MNSPGAGDDPIHDALVSGNDALPDGRALAKLGSLVRNVSQAAPAPDAAPHIRLRLGPADPDRLVDRYFDGGRCDDPALASLGRLVSQVSQPPRPVDLSSRVLARLDGAQRSSRRLGVDDTVTMDPEGRRRIWWWVCVGHLAAALLLVILRPDPQVVAQSSDTAPAAAPERPASWSDGGVGLLITRERATSRTALAISHGLGEVVPTVAAGCRWLVDQQRIGGTDDGRLSPSDLGGTRAVAIHAFATLALLGEGLDDHEREIAIHRALGWLDRQPVGDDPQTLGVVAWCRVEAALLVGDPNWRTAAELSLGRLTPNLGGAGATPSLLALETAAAGGLTVPRRQLEAARRQIGRPLPRDDDPAQLGLAALTRMVIGLRGLESTHAALERLDHLETPGQPDPLSWIAPSLALREAGGERWSRWATRRLLPLAERFVSDNRGFSYVPADSVRWAGDAGGSVAATAWTLLCLQAPYRTVPLAGSGK